MDKRTARSRSDTLVYDRRAGNSDIICFPKVEWANRHKDQARIVDFMPEIAELFEQRIEMRKADAHSADDQPTNDWADGTRGPYTRRAHSAAHWFAICGHPRKPLQMRPLLPDVEALDALNFLQKVPLTINRRPRGCAWASEDPERHENIEGFPALRDRGAQEYPKDASQYAREDVAISRNIKHMKKRRDTVKSNLVTFEDDICRPWVCRGGRILSAIQFRHQVTHLSPVEVWAPQARPDTRDGPVQEWIAGHQRQCAPSEIQSRQYMGQCSQQH